MPLYALYVPTAHAAVSGLGLERFTSRELAERILKERNATCRSKTFYVSDGKQPWERPEQAFPWADASGYLRVYLRKAADPVPSPLDTPDEEWVTEPGGRQGKVVRLVWSPGTERVGLERKTGLLCVTPRPPRTTAPPSPPPKREVACAAPSCPRLFSAPCASIRDFNRMLMEQGWRWRGSVTGQAYYCGAHVD